MPRSRDEIKSLILQIIVQTVEIYGSHEKTLVIQGACIILHVMVRRERIFHDRHARAADRRRAELTLRSAPEMC
jgi:hypothetical protein